MRKWAFSEQSINNVILSYFSPILVNILKCENKLEGVKVNIIKNSSQNE